MVFAAEQRGGHLSARAYPSCYPPVRFVGLMCWLRCSHLKWCPSYAFARGFFCAAAKLKFAEKFGRFCLRLWFLEPSLLESKILPFVSTGQGFCSSPSVSQPFWKMGGLRPLYQMNFVFLGVMGIKFTVLSPVFSDKKSELSFWLCWKWLGVWRLI